MLRRISPSMAVSLLALFIALGGAGYAATGGNFILGTPNTATSATELTASGATTLKGLKVTNTNTAAGATALELNTPAGHAPLKVTRSAKVALLNVDFLDSLDSTAFLRKGLAQTGDAIYGDNTGTGYAGFFEDKVHIGGALDCNGCVDAADVSGKVANADTLDG